MNDQKRRPELLITIFLIVCYAVTFLILNFKYLPQFTDGDIYADMLLSRLIWEQKKLFPANWIYGNQYYVIATPVIASVFYGITGSMNAAMAAATTLMGAFIAASYLWMVSSFCRNRTACLLSLLVLLAAPAGQNLLLLPQGQLLFTLASYYSCYLITIFVVFGCYIRSWNSSSSRISIISWIISILLSFACGMQSLRQTAIMILPLCVIEFCVLLFDAVVRKRFGKELNKLSHLFVIVCTLANLLGHFFMQWLKIPAKTIYGTVTLDQSTAFVERLRSLWYAVRGICGIDASQNGLFYVLLMIFFFALAVVTVVVLKKLYQKDPNGAALWSLFSVSLIITGAVSLVLSVAMRQIYLFLWYPLLAVSALLLITNCGDKAGKILSCLICVFAFFNLFFSYGSSVSYAEKKEVSPMQEFCEDAVAAGHRIVYGGWDVTPQFLVWSDGDLTGAFWEEPTFYIRDHINLTDVYSEKDNESAVYLFSKWDLAPNAEIIESEMEYFGTYGTYTAYTAGHQLMRWPEWLAFMNETG